MFLSRKYKKIVREIVDESWEAAGRNKCLESPESRYRFCQPRCEARINGLRSSVRRDSGPGSMITSIIISLMVKLAIKLLLKKLRSETEHERE